MSLRVFEHKALVVERVAAHDRYGVELAQVDIVSICVGGCFHGDDSPACGDAQPQLAF